MSGPSVSITHANEIFHFCKLDYACLEFPLNYQEIGHSHNSQPYQLST